MAFDKDNNGRLFKSHNRDAAKNQPEYSGNCIVNGKEMRISGWVKTGPSGAKFFSLAFSEPKEKSEPRTQSAPPNKIDTSDYPKTCYPATEPTQDDACPF